MSNIFPSVNRFCVTNYFINTKKIYKRLNRNYVLNEGDMVYRFMDPLSSSVKVNNSRQ